MRFPIRLLTAVAAIAATSLSLPQQAAADPAIASLGRVQASWIVKTSAQCTGEVLHSAAGNLILTARHCGDIDSVTTTDGTTFPVTSQTDAVGDVVTSDLSVLTVDGDIEKVTHGGFRIGTAPTAGQSVNIWGYPAFSASLRQCGDQIISYDGVSPEVNGCALPDGTSGSPWFTSDSVLRGVTSGLNEGGATDLISDSVPFSPTVLTWLRSFTGGHTTVERSSGTSAPTGADTVSGRGHAAVA